MLIKVNYSPLCGTPIFDSLLYFSSLSFSKFTIFITSGNGYNDKIISVINLDDEVLMQKKQKKLVDHHFLCYDLFLRLPL